MQRPTDPKSSYEALIDDLLDNLATATTDPEFTHLSAILKQARRQAGSSYTRDDAIETAKLLVAICEAKGTCPVSSAMRMERMSSVKMPARIIRREVERLAESRND